jgi:DNA-binding GntR family transcriptional regulator
VDEHFRMIELAAAGDRDAIRPLMRHHIVTWRPVFAAALEAREERRR